MIGGLFQALAALAGAVAGAILLDKGVEMATGKGIVERLTGTPLWDWWHVVNDRHIQPWIQQNRHLSLSHIVAVVVRLADRTAAKIQQVSRVRLEAVGHDGLRNVIETDCEVSTDDLKRVQPGVRKGSELVLIQF
ncbi:MAG: hypothetical protein IT428_11230 [Planctomycetaceae bacterium]|nr:hypothetical protein [Planctomycetaceae bacterium]